MRRDGGKPWEAWLSSGQQPPRQRCLILAPEMPCLVCFRLDSATGVHWPCTGTVKWRKEDSKLTAYSWTSLSQSCSWERWIVFSQVHIGPVKNCLFFTFSNILYFSSFKGICVSKKFKINMVRYCFKFNIYVVRWACF